jgi:hypothetical protein
MGYTTEFTGAFSCYHPENETVGAFLKAIRDGDCAAIAALGDWLLDRDDPRSEAVARVAIDGNDRLDSLWPHFGLRPAHAAYLRKFSRTRRMKRDAERAKLLPDPIREAAGLPLGPDAGYFVGGVGWAGQEVDESVLEHGNRPPEGQPGLWCRWTANEKGTAIEWDGGEKFYDYVKWLGYLVAHFLGPWGYLLNGEVTWQGEDESDTGRIVVVENAIRATPSMRG